MAKNTKKQALLQTRDSNSEPRTERADHQPDTLTRVFPRSINELSPFQRVKRGAECFLAPEILPIRGTVN
jgi:hypothetical protein